jgi:hypothetical protein
MSSPLLPQRRSFAGWLGIGHFGLFAFFITGHKTNNFTYLRPWPLIGLLANE